MRRCARPTRRSSHGWSCPSSRVSLRCCCCLFTKPLLIPSFSAVGSVGSIGGKYSHEWLLETPLGEDEVYSCRACGESFNAELVLEQQLESEDSGQSSPPPHCLNCGNTDQALLPRRRALELGHSFLLSDRYSSKMGAYYLSEHTNRQV